MVHTVNNGVVHVLPGRGNDDFVRAGRQVGAGRFTAAKESGGLVDNLHTQFGDEPNVLVNDPKLLCAPAIKTLGGGQIFGDLTADHLKC